MFDYTVDGISFTSDIELTEEEQQEVSNNIQNRQSSLQQQDVVEETDEEEIALKGTEYDPIFEEIGKQYNVNPDLLKAIAKQESDFDPTAEGESGEIGMMQLMPIIRDEYIPNQDPTDPRNSVIGAAKFIQHLNKKYNNDPDKVLQAYNGGETLLDKNPEGIQQTQDYRDSVIRYMSSAQGFKQQKVAQPITGSAVSKEKQEVVSDEFKIKYDDLHENEDYFDRVEDYMISRFGQEFNYDKEKESKKDYVRKFANHMRNVYYNNLDLTKEVLWTSGANKLERESSGFAFTLWEAIPIFDGGYNKFEAFADFGTAVLSDPTTYFGAIGGKLVSLAGSKTALKLAREKFKQESLVKSLKQGVKKTEAKENLKKVEKQLKEHVAKNRIQQIGTGLGIEATVGSYAGGLDSTLAIQQYREATFDKTRPLIGGAVAGVFGAISAIPVAALSKELNNSEKLIKDFEKKIKQGKSITLKGTAPKELKELLSKTDEQLGEIFKHDPNAGRIVIDKLSTEKNELLQAQVRQKLYPMAVKIAGHIMMSDLRRFGPQKELINGKEKTERISTALNRIIADFGKMDSLTIESAAVKAGIDPDTYAQRVQKDLLDVLTKYKISPEDFSQAMNTTVSDSAKVLQPYSYVSNMYKAMTGTDREAQKFMDTLYTEHYNGSWFSTFANGFHRLERTSKIWVTSALSTTSLNIIGTMGGLTMKAAADTFESLFQRGIKGVAISMGADPKTLKIREPKSIGEIFSTFGKMTNYGMTSVEADEILKFNPAIRNKLVNTLAIGEGDREVGRISKFLSSLNLAQDAFFRRSVFVSAVESELKFLGKDLYKDYLKKNIPIPEKVLRRATDDAMRSTFSYQFQANKSSKLDQAVLEAQGNSIARRFIDHFENVPFMSLFAPFPRFMANAVNFQYRYSLGGTYSGLSDLRAGLTGRGKGKNLTDDQRAALIKKGSEAFSKGMVGNTVLGMAVLYRMQEENRERNWWDIKLPYTDTGFDARAFFPIAPYFAIAELMVRTFNLAGDRSVKEMDTSFEDVIQSTLGLKARDLDLFPDYFLKALKDLRSGVDTEKALNYIGQAGFNFGGRFLQPIKPFREYFDGMSFEGLMARDPNVIDLDIYTGEKEGNVLLETLSNQIKNKLPDVVDNYGKDSLAKAKQYFVEGPPSGAGRFFSNFMGLKITREQTKIEKEVTRLGITPWKMEVYKPIGIKAWDNVVISNGLYFLEYEVNNLMNTDRYKNEIDSNKKGMLEAAIRRSFTNAKNDLRRRGIDERDGSKISDDLIKLTQYLDYRQISRKKRKIIEEMYKNDHPENKELGDTKEYGKAMQYLDRIPF